MQARWIPICVLIIGSVLALVLGVGLGLAHESQGDVAPQATLGTAFTYQGYLTQVNTPVDGICSFQFGLWDANSGGHQIGVTQTVSSVRVDRGYFGVELNGGSEFGSQAFTGDARYLAIAVQCSGDSIPVQLGRVALTAAPYALYAQKVPWSGLSGIPYTSGDVTGTYPNLTIVGLQGYPVANIAPVPGQMLRWSGSAWEPATANLPPVAILQVDPPVLYLGETTTGAVTLSLTLSYDPESGPLTYAFDPTGRQTGTPISYGSSPIVATVYNATGDYLAVGWARDESGAFSAVRVMVSVYRFGSTVADSAGEVGAWASLVVVQDRPAIAYFDDTNDDLKYVRANDTAGLSWTTPVTADSTDSVGRDASMAIVDGHPAIAYLDATNNNLKYVRADDATGFSWHTPAVVDHAGDITVYSSRAVALAVIEGYPTIAYYDHDGSALKYARATDLTGSSWGTPVTVYSGTWIRYVSLAFVGGYPAIAYFDGSSNDLKYVHANDVTGSSWATPLTLDSSETVVGWHASLAVVSGHPAVAYKYETAGCVRYVYASDAVGSSWGTPITVDCNGTVGNWLSMAVVSGRPALAYDDITTANYDLKYVRANNVTGSSWGAPVVVESAANVGGWASLAEVDGRPAIAHKDGTHGDLLFSIPRQE